LGIGRSQFFNLLKKYRDSHDNFSIAYKRKINTNELESGYDDVR
jgi:hypothetical protein